MVVLLVAGLAFAGTPAAAQDSSGGASPPPAAAPSHAPSHDDSDEGTIISGPFSDYGEFDTDDDEAEDEKFFQFGRFFGLGVHAGYTTATGNAGRLYQGGFPTAGLRIAYWFDFRFALQINFEQSKHSYDVPPHGPSDVNLFRTSGQLKYYFDTKDLSAPITFVGPHLLFGGGYYQRTDNIGAGSTSATDKSVETQSAFGFNGGFGLELTLKPKKTYLQLETLVHFVNFADQLTPTFVKAGIPDRTGAWVSTSLAVMWTW